MTTAEDTYYDLAEGGYSHYLHEVLVNGVERTGKRVAALYDPDEEPLPAVREVALDAQLQPALDVEQHVRERQTTRATQESDTESDLTELSDLSEAEDEAEPERCVQAEPLTDDESDGADRPSRRKGKRTRRMATDSAYGSTGVDRGDTSRAPEKPRKIRKYYPCPDYEGWNQANKPQRHYYIFPVAVGSSASYSSMTHWKLVQYSLQEAQQRYGQKFDVMRFNTEHVYECQLVRLFFLLILVESKISG